MPERQLLCPACQTPLPASGEGTLVVTCLACATEVDIARINTVVGKPRFVPERLWTGSTIGSFVVGELLGTGGMGTVYRACDSAGSPVAIKFMAPSLAAHTESVARFKREIALLSRLDHPGVVRIIDHGESMGIPWLAMELVEGPTLAQRISKSPLSLDESRHLFEMLLRALAHAHASGIVHRDLKPGNVLLAPNGPKVADFGIAHLDVALASRSTQLTSTHAVLGTFPYMSPEQRAGRPLDARSDLYSVGVMFYEAITGDRPEGAFASLHSRNRKIPIDIDRWLLKLLQPDPKARIASAEEAARLLTRATSPRRVTATLSALGFIAIFLVIGLSVFEETRNSPGANSTPLRLNPLRWNATAHVVIAPLDTPVTPLRIARKSTNKVNPSIFAPTATLGSKVATKTIPTESTKSKTKAKNNEGSIATTKAPANLPQVPTKSSDLVFDESEAPPSKERKVSNSKHPKKVPGAK